MSSWPFLPTAVWCVLWSICFGCGVVIGVWLGQSSRDRRVAELARIICAILAADERGQGVRFGEAMDAAARAVGWRDR